MKVAIYARVSTPGQELDHQIMACRKLAEAKDLEVGEVYRDIGSGVKFTRPQFQIMLNRLRSRYYDGVIAFKLDRLGRRAGDLGLLLETLLCGLGEKARPKAYPGKKGQEGAGSPGPRAILSADKSRDGALDRDHNEHNQREGGMKWERPYNASTVISLPGLMM